MKTMNKIAIIMVFLAFACEERENQQIDAHSIEGDWVGINWYCHNTTPSGVCVVYPEDSTATFEFQIFQKEGKLEATDGVLKQPTCMNNPSCNPPDGIIRWKFDSLYYKKDGGLYIKWVTHATNWFAFSVGVANQGTGRYDRFKGGVVAGFDSDPDHAGGDTQYIWAEPVEIIKQ